MIKPTMDCIRVGVAGAGYWGPKIIRNCLELGVLGAVCDTDDVALASVRSMDPDICVTSDFHQMLTLPIDAVIVATPAVLHKEMCLQAINAGKHIFVEKPLALSVADGQQIVAAARAAEVSVFVGHLLLYHPGVRKLRALVGEGAIGDVWHLRSRRLSLGRVRDHENVWWSFAPHDIAVMLAVMAEEPRHVVASHSASGCTGLTDTAYADFEFSGGRTAHIEVSWLEPEKAARLDVFGTHGVLTLDDTRDQEKILTSRPFSIAQDGRERRVPIRGAESRVNFEHTEPLQAELVEFLESIQFHRSSETDGDQGVAVLRALTMAEAAVRQQAELIV